MTGLEFFPEEQEVPLLMVGRYSGDPKSRKVMAGLSVFVLSAGSFLGFLFNQSKFATITHGAQEHHVPPWAFIIFVFAWIFGPSVIYGFWAAYLSPDYF